MSPEIHNLATVSPQARLSDSCRIEAGAWIGPGVELGEGVVVGPHAVLGQGPGDGRPLRIGDHTAIASHACIDAGSEIGPNGRIGHFAIIRQNSRVGRDAYIGDRCTLMGNGLIEEYAFLHSEVHICEHAHLQEHCQVMPGVMLLNDPYPPTQLSVIGPTIGPCAIVGARAIIWPGIKLGYHAMVASMSEVRHDVADFMLVRGRPAEVICDVRRIRMKAGGRWVYPYPWMRHHIEGEDISRPVI